MIIRYSKSLFKWDEYLLNVDVGRKVLYRNYYIVYFFCILYIFFLPFFVFQAAFFFSFFGLLVLRQYFVLFATGLFLKLYNVQLRLFDLIDLITSRRSILLAGLEFPFDVPSNGLNIHPLLLFHKSLCFRCINESNILLRIKLHKLHTWVQLWLFDLKTSSKVYSWLE